MLIRLVFSVRVSGDFWFRSDRISTDFQVGHFLDIMLQVEISLTMCSKAKIPKHFSSGFPATDFPMTAFYLCVDLRGRLSRLAINRV